ncbi:hypothetical protein Leryth_014129 [Lithospermum erythrorhizon]|nr:hypothetical protein Leryth_014129 [Lithospermum erythrorhizon]
MTMSHMGQFPWCLRSTGWQLSSVLDASRIMVSGPECEHFRLKNGIAAKDQLLKENIEGLELELRKLEGAFKLRPSMKT